MSFLKMNLWKIGFFNQAKFMFSSPMRASMTVFVSETGLISKETFPMSTGYISSVASKMAWLVAHSLKMKLGNTKDTVLLISERSYVPLDPFGKFTDEDRKNLTRLSYIAKMKHAEMLATISEKNNGGSSGLLKTALTGSFLIIAMIIIMNMVSC